MAEFPDPWPLWHLVLRTPRLELRPDDDAGLRELVDESYRGVHPPEEMPFTYPWTDSPWDELGTLSLCYYWGFRSRHRPDDWRITFLVRLDGQVIGAQTMTAQDFSVVGEIDTGSWIGMRHQGKGYGAEMRAAVLMFAFDHLGARRARSAAFVDNHRSLGVSRKLGYVDDGTLTVSRRGKPAEQVRLVLTAERFAEHRPQWTLGVSGLDRALPAFGIAGTDMGLGATRSSHPD